MLFLCVFPYSVDDVPIDAAGVLSSGSLRSTASSAHVVHHFQIKYCTKKGEQCTSSGESVHCTTLGEGVQYIRSRGGCTLYNHDKSA